jgi:hypothetical protein
MINLLLKKCYCRKLSFCISSVRVLRNAATPELPEYNRLPSSDGCLVVAPLQPFLNHVGKYDLAIAAGPRNLQLRTFLISILHKDAGKYDLKIAAGPRHLQLITFLSSIFAQRRGQI